MVKNIAELFVEQARVHADLPLQYFKNSEGHFVTRSYAEALVLVADLAQALRSLQVAKGDRVGLIADNKPEWLLTDFAVLGLGAADVPRGCDATAAELEYILGFSECKIAFFEDLHEVQKVFVPQGEQIRVSCPLLKTIILYDAGADEAQRTKYTDYRAQLQSMGITVLEFAELLARGARDRAAGIDTIELYKTSYTGIQRRDLATIIFTSGTTGTPKGVMLCHENFLYQLEVILQRLFIKPGHIFVSVLPIWHVFERIALYMILGASAATAYSKPLGTILLADIAELKPQWLPSVPRLWEAILNGIQSNVRKQSPLRQKLFSFFIAVAKAYAFFRNHLIGAYPRYKKHSRLLEILWSLVPLILLAPLRGLGYLLVYKKILARLGGKFVAGISGGGSLPASVDSFFNALNIKVLEGYGLTETAPVIGVRHQYGARLYTIGRLLEGTHVHIKDEAGNILPVGQVGRVFVKGKQVMLGYYKQEELTAKVFDADGYFDTGDLGVLSLDNELSIKGRLKDTIVLRGGENVEPFPLEQKINTSKYIFQSLVLGQDQRSLSALIVPDEEALKEFATIQNIVYSDYRDLLSNKAIEKLIREELERATSVSNACKPYECVSHFCLIAEPFRVGEELSAKQEVKRHVINKKYAAEINSLMSN